MLKVYENIPNSDKMQVLIVEAQAEANEESHVYKPL